MFPDVDTFETVHVAAQSPTRPPTRAAPETVAFITVMFCKVMLPEVRPARVPTETPVDVAENPSRLMFLTVAPASLVNNPQPVVVQLTDTFEIVFPSPFKLPEK